MGVIMMNHPQKIHNPPKNPIYHQKLQTLIKTPQKSPQHTKIPSRPPKVIESPAFRDDLITFYQKRTLTTLMLSSIVYNPHTIIPITPYSSTFSDERALYFVKLYSILFCVCFGTVKEEKYI